MARLRRMGSSFIERAMTGSAVAITVESRVCMKRAHPTMVGTTMLATEGERRGAFILRQTTDREGSPYVAGAPRGGRVRSARMFIVRGSRRLQRIADEGARSES